jgi:predicted ester cyclase
LTGLARRRNIQFSTNGIRQAVTVRESAVNAGVVRGKLKADRIDEAVEAFRTEAIPALTRIPGFVDVQLWLDRGSGEWVGVGVYETTEAQAAAGRVFAESAAEIAERGEGGPPARETYSLAASAAIEAQDIVERCVAAIGGGDLERLARDLAPEVRVSYRRPGGTEIVGPQAVKEHYQAWRAAFPDLRLETRRVVATGRMVVVEAAYSGTHGGTLGTPAGEVAGTGRRVSGECVLVFTVDGGAVSEIHTHTDYGSLLAQVGVASAQVRSST